MVNFPLIRDRIEAMPWLNVVLFVYALLNLTMGLLGYFRANSIWSLVAGVTCGLIVLVSILLTRTKPRTARITALVVALLLVGRFAPKTFQNELYPSGIMFASSVAVALCLLAGHMMGMKAKRAQAAEAAESRKK